MFLKLRNYYVLQKFWTKNTLLICMQWIKIKFVTKQKMKKKKKITTATCTVTLTLQYIEALLCESARLQRYSLYKATEDNTEHCDWN